MVWRSRRAPACCCAPVNSASGLCFANIGAILASAGMELSDVVRLSAFVTGREHLPAYMAVRDRLFPDAASAPASTLMIVTGFSRPEFKVEVEAIAARI